MGSIFSGLIIDENDKAYFVQKEGITFRLDKEEGEHKLGEAVEGFAYQNQNQDYRNGGQVVFIQAKSLCFFFYNFQRLFIPVLLQLFLVIPYQVLQTVARSCYSNRITGR